LEHREDRWIVSRLDQLTNEVNESLAAFELGDAQQKLYDFIWNDFCDWHIEMAKVRLRAGSGPSPLPVLAHVLERSLRLLHPFMPFITEAIWQNLVSRLPMEGDLPESIMIARYPQATKSRYDRQAEEEITLVMQTIRAVRNTRSQLQIPASQNLEALVEADDYQTLIEEESEVIRTLSRIEPLRVVSNATGQDSQVRSIALVVTPLVVRLPVEGVVNLSAEQTRLQKELDNCQNNLKRVETLVSNPAFRAKARPEVVETEEERLRSLNDQQQRLEEILTQLGG